jgi:hypothetical protein
MTILLLRFSLVLLLYLFLGGLVVTIWRDIQRPRAVEMVDAKPQAQLVVVEAGSTDLCAGYAFTLAGDCSIGRGSENDIVLSDSFVSTSHAAISFRNGTFWIEDLGSRNGSFVNGLRVDAMTQLRPGDQIAIGQVELRLSE